MAYKLIQLAFQQVTNLSRPSVAPAVPSQSLSIPLPDYTALHDHAPKRPSVHELCLSLYTVATTVRGSLSQKCSQVHVYSKSV